MNFFVFLIISVWYLLFISWHQHDGIQVVTYIFVTLFKFCHFSLFCITKIYTKKLINEQFKTRANVYVAE